MSIRRDLERRAQEAILKNIIENYKKKHLNWYKDPAIRKSIFNYAFFKPANAILIAATIIAAGCLPLLVLPVLALTSPLWLALGALVPIVLGLAAEAFFLTLSFKDEEAHAQAVADLLRPKVEFNPKTIHSKDLKEKVDKALEYWGLIDEAIAGAPKGVVREPVLNTPHQVTHQEMTRWLQAVYNLAEHVDKFRNNKVLERDLEEMPLIIEGYRQKLQEEENAEVQRQLKRTLADKERQLNALQKLKDNMSKADYQLDSTISALGTIYSQLLLMGSKDEMGSNINNIQEEISEQVNQLEDLTEAMDEVYQSSY